MSGGAWEYTAAYLSNNNESLTTYGESLVNGEGKYKDMYTLGTSDTPANNYAKASEVYGDAVYEASENGVSGNGAWYQDYSTFVETSYSFFIQRKIEYNYKKYRLNKITTSTFLVSLTLLVMHKFNLGVLTYLAKYNKIKAKN